MSIDKKKLAVITAAVFKYIKTQEEASEIMSTGMTYSATNMAQPCLPVWGNNSNYPNVWCIAGRSAQMQIRSMMEMRTFK